MAETRIDRYNVLLSELNGMTKEQLVTRILAERGFSRDEHSCQRCEFFKIWGHDYSQYFDCTFTSDYRQLTPETIKKNRCLDYKEMKLVVCPSCSKADLEKVIVVVDIDPYTWKPDTGYHCSSCKTIFVIKGDALVAKV